ncbi:MAG: MFS transporter [Acidobacteriota bacterium]
MESAAGHRDPVAAVIPRSAWQALFAGQLGWMLDSFDFLLFTFALRAIQKEFGASSSTMGLLTSVALVCGAGGGIVFGRLADRYGRVRAMTWSMLVYSGATAALATSSAIWQLFLWRAVVGLGMGGEWSCGSVLVAESWPAEHRARGMGMMQAAWAVGALAAAGVSALVLEPFGWRTLFVIGVVPAIVAFFIRRTVPEPEIWRKQRSAAKASSSLRELFRAPLARRTFLASSLAAVVLIAYWGVFTWLPSYLATPVLKGGAGLTLTRSAGWIVVVQLGALAGYLAFGWIADTIGRRPAFTLFMIAAAVAVPIYANARRPALLLIVGLLVGFFGSGYFSMFGALLAELYPTRIRGTAQGFCYNIGRLASAGAPFAIGAAGDAYGLGMAIALMSVFFAIGAVLVWTLPETRGRALLVS